MSENKNDLVAYLLLVITGIIWGATWPLGRWMVTGDDAIPPLVIVVVRYFFVVIAFFIILMVKDGKKLDIIPVKSHWKVFLFMGLTSVTLYQFGYMLGEFYTAASDASIIVTANSFLVIILSTLVLKMENLTWNKIAGVLLAFIGVILTVGFSPNVNVANRLLGDLLIFLAALAYASYTVTLRRYLNTFETSEQPSSIYLVTWVSLFGFLATIPIIFLLHPEYLNFNQFLLIPTRIWLGIFYLSFISTLLGYTFYMEGVKRLDASRAAVFQTLVPVFGVLLSGIFLEEIINPLIHGIALILIAGGIILVNQRKDF